MATVKRLLLVSFLLVLFTFSPVSAQPGSEEDPLVSKKYVDDQINVLKDFIAQSGQADPPADMPPLIGTPSYAPPASVEITPEIRAGLLAEALAGFENIYGDMLRQAAANAAGTNGNYPGQMPPAEAPRFEVVYAESGTVIYCGAGTELILRSGIATVVSGVNGICDVTSGVDLTDGQAVPQNHMLIVPSDDGRGVMLSTEAYLMIKGGYYFG